MTTMLLDGVILFLLALVWTLLRTCCSAYEHGLRHGYAKGRREIDKWWVEMDQQLDEEWAKIWREER